MKNKIIITGAFLFYILVQWYGVYFMFYNHAGPLGLEDAASYIEKINYFKLFPISDPGASPCAINKILHPWFFGVLALLTGLSAENMFHVNFYIGLFLMGLTLLLFFRKVEPSAIFIGTAFAIFAFYEGKGSYHGFFWVVPSFYAVMLFLLAAIALFHSRHHYLYGTPILLLLMLTHSTGAYLAGVLITAMLIHAIIFERKFERLKSLIFPIAGGLVILIASEYLHSIGMMPKSFLANMQTYSSIQAGSVPDSSPLWWRILEQSKEAILETVKRHDFSKYFYGINTPLVAYGVYQAYQHRRFPMLSLFIALLAGQILMSPVSVNNYRFFYPLEIVTWIVMAYGIRHLLPKLFIKKLRQAHGVATNASLIALLSLSLLFLYNAIHQKADHTWRFKFESPRFFDETAFLEYVRVHPEKNWAVYTFHKGNYLGLEGARKTINFSFAPSGSTIAAEPEKWIVIGETHRFLNAYPGGFRVVLPRNASLKINTGPLQPGRYRLELLDNDFSDEVNLIVGVNGRSVSTWKENPLQVRYPESSAYPPILLPWYSFRSTPWPLFKRPLHRDEPIRVGKRYAVAFSLEKTVNTVFLQNNGQTQYMAGEIVLVNLDTGMRRHYDLYWGNDGVLESALSLVYNGEELPMLWTDPNGGPGKEHLFRLERNFLDVKAFSYYIEASAL